MKKKGGKRGKKIPLIQAMILLVLKPNMLLSSKPHHPKTYNQRFVTILSPQRHDSPTTQCKCAGKA
jgi:hypothetical protein